MFDLSGQGVVVTGGTKGIGLGIAQQMAAHGSKVIVSSRDQPLCDQVIADLNTSTASDELLKTNVHHTFRLAETLRGDIVRQGDAIILVGSIARA